MSADMMIICKEDKSSYEGGNYEAAFKIDETYLGEPWTKFGKWFGVRYCGAPTMLEQMAGVKEHRYIELTLVGVADIKKALDNMEHACNKEELIQYLERHIGKHISTENW